jgi:hypothetical protein
MKKFINLSSKNMSKRIQGEVIDIKLSVIDPFYTEDMIEDTVKELIEEIKKLVEGERCIVHLDNELNAAFVFYFIKNKRFNMELVTSSWENGKLVRFIKLV